MNTKRVNCLLRKQIIQKKENIFFETIISVFVIPNLTAALDLEFAESNLTLDMN